MVWNTFAGPEGIQGLEFWLKSLKAHLPPISPAAAVGEKPDYSIIVVGTHVDRLTNPAATFPRRKEDLENLFKKLEVPSFDYLEVSSRNHINLDQLRQKIIDAALGHSNMRELVPESYLKVERDLEDEEGNPGTKSSPG